jgi:hypothetical protein
VDRELREERKFGEAVVGVLDAQYEFVLQWAKVTLANRDKPKSL